VARERDLMPGRHFVLHTVIAMGTQNRELVIFLMRAVRYMRVCGWARRGPRPTSSDDNIVWLLRIFCIKETMILRIGRVVTCDM